jgi:signal transduction histidine kinase/ligand-binding sensor domain-containing protein/DNA-binding NarL/FixJ family response regulator
MPRLTDLVFAARGLVLLLLAPVWAFAAEEIRFERLTMEQGLSQSSVSSIAQCTDGYLWFGTQYGLDRFDGYNIRSFRHDPEDPGTLDHSLITDLKLARDGRMWVTTERGLNLFDTQSGRAERFAMSGSAISGAETSLTEVVAEHDDGRLFLSASGRVRIWYPETRRVHRIPFSIDLAHDQLADRSASLDAQGRYWVFNAAGLWRFDEVTRQMDLVMPLEQNPSFRMFHAMTVTSDGALALAADDVFMLVDPDSLEVLERLTLEDVGGVDARFNAVMASDDGMVWLPTTNRLLRYEPSDRSITVLYDQGRLDPTENARQLLDMHQHPNGDLWFASQYGLARLEAETGATRVFGHDPNDPFSLPQTIPQVPIELFIDRQGLVWVGTHLGGVGWHVPDNARFRHILDTSRPTNTAVPFAGQNVVRGITETEIDGQLDLWLALDRAGLRRLRLGSNDRFEWYRSYHNGGQQRFRLPEDDVRSVEADPAREVVWVLTRRYLIPIDARSDDVLARFSLREMLGADTGGQTLKMSGDGQSLWLGTGQGAWQLGVGQSPASTPSVGHRHLPGLNVSDLLETATGTWVAVGFQGFGYMVPERPDQDIFLSTEELHTERNAALHTIVPHEQGGWWIGGREVGLAHLRISTGVGGARDFEIDWFDRKDGLVDDTIYAILPDPSGNLWLSSNNGLMRWYPEDDRIRHFTPLDGVQALEFNRGVAHLGQRGDFYFGGINGVNRFRPSRFDSLLPAPRVHLQEVRVNGQPIDLDGANKPELRLAHDENDLEIRFVGLQFSDPQRVRYAFRLEGVDTDWVDSSNRREVRYASLSPGDYRFFLRAANNDGVWSDDHILLTASVSPPPWATPWALGLYGFVFLILAGLLYGGTLRRRRALEAEVAARTAALTEQQALVRRQARELEQALESRTVLFANVSHEFRTPLTLIKASLDRIEREGSDPQALATGHRYLRRLLRLVDQLLDFSRLSYEQRETPGEPWPLGRMVRLTVDAFSQVALERDIELLPDVEPGWRTRCDQEQIEKILLNLLTNALKFTPGGGQVRVRLKAGDQGVDLIVADSGPGIPAGELETIFERFYRVPASEGGAVDGAGIGLALVREAALANGGDVQVESESGRGTRFTVSLPAWRDPNAAGPMQLLAHGERVRDIEALMPVKGQVAVADNEDPAGSLPRALVVEDNSDMRRYLEEILAPAWQVRQAADGAEALEAAWSFQPDVVVSDIMMPELDGFELLKRLRDDVRTSHIPVMLLTARRDRDTRVQSFVLSADDFLAKPFDPHELVARLQAMLERRQRLRENLRAQLAERTQTSPPLAAETAGDDISSRDRELLERIHGWLEESYGNPEISVTDMAAAALVDLRTLQRKLKSLLDRTPAVYLQEFRLQQARRMLLENGRSIKDVAATCGFSSAQAFTKIFGQVEGVPPSVWRQNHKPRANNL